MKIIHKHLPAIIFTITVFFQIYLISKGLDLTDEGFVLTMYQNFIGNPSFSSGAGGYPLSVLVGSLLNLIWPQGGIFWIRLCGLALQTIVLFLAYKILREYINKTILVGALCCATMILSGDPHPLSYNGFSAFFAILSIFFLHKGCTNENVYQTIIGGISAGIALFFRIPNICFFSFAIIPLFYNYNWHRRIKNSLLFILGWMIGLVGGWGILKIFNANQIVVTFISSIFGLLNGETTHSSSTMLSNYLNNYNSAFYFACICIGAIAISNYINNRIARIIFSTAVFFALYQTFYIHIRDLGEQFLECLNGIGLIGSAILLRDKRIRPIAAAGILISFCVPFGSDRGFETSWAGLWLLLPLGFYGIYNGEKQKGHSTNIIIALIVFFILVTTLKSSKRAYFDGHSRFNKNAEIESIYAKHIHTSDRRAGIINSLLNKLSALNVNEGDTILVYSSSPLVYYLTNTKPFDHLNWPCVHYGERYIDDFSKIISENPPPKAIIIQNFWSLGNADDWSNPDSIYCHPNIDMWMASKQMNKVVLDYIDTIKYDLKWSNDYFDIYGK